jgi:hypothetical protein
MTSKRRKELTKLFKAEISDRSKSIDPENELDWYSLTIGWAIAHGELPSEAEMFSIYVRYHTDLA